MKKMIAVSLVPLLLFCGTVCARIWYDEDGYLHDDECQNYPSDSKLLYQMFSDMAEQYREQARDQMRNQYGEQAVEQFNQIAKCYDCGGSGICSSCHGSGIAGPDDYLGKDIYSGGCSSCSGNGQCYKCFGSGQIF